MGPAPEDFDLILFGTGSALNVLEPFLEMHPHRRVAVIEREQPGGICLTRGCIPSKMLVRAADVVQAIRRAPAYGIRVGPARPDFARVVRAMRRHVDHESEEIAKGLRSDPRIEFIQGTAAFDGPNTLHVGRRRLRASTIFLCTGSRPLVPEIEGLADVAYDTTDTIFHIKRLPRSLVIVGGGYIAAEFGHFFSAMGTKVTILGRNRRFHPDEEPEIGAVVRRQLGTRCRIETGNKVVRVSKRGKKLLVEAWQGGRKLVVSGERLLLAAGRRSNTDWLEAPKGGVEVDEEGWIKVDQHLATTALGVYAFGDALGRHLFKHTANYESEVAFRNAFSNEKTEPDYHAVPRAVFTDPEVAAVGMGEADAIDTVGRQNVLVGSYRFQDTARGKAMGSMDHFVKGLVDARSGKILGAHIVGPQASTLIQEVIAAMNSAGVQVDAIRNAIHIHPALPEVVERALGRLESVDAYHERLRDWGLETV